MTEKACIVCGKPFEQKRASQKYCSATCRKRANRTDGIAPRDAWTSEGEEIRSFACVKCGTVVRVTSMDDRRTKFCSHRCERLYWKHSRFVAPQIVRREFDCKGCGRHVIVKNARDFRYCFCSAGCRQKWHILRQKEMTQQKKTEQQMYKEE